MDKLRKEEGKLTPAAVLMETAQAASKVTGVPVKSIVRDAMAIMDTAMNAAGGEADCRWLRLEYDINRKDNVSMYAGMILEAREQGNGKLAEQIKEDMKDAGWSADEVKSAMNSVVNRQVKEEADILGAAAAYDTGKKETLAAFQEAVQAYIELKGKVGWDKEKCLKQIRSSLTREYRTQWKEAETQKERDAILKKLRSLYFEGDSLYKGYDFSSWKKDGEKEGDEWDF